MATIRKRKGKWQVQVRHLGHNQISKTFLRKQEAEQWARELEVSFDQGSLASRSVEYPMFSEIIERYTKEVSAKKRGAHKGGVFPQATGANGSGAKKTGSHTVASHCQAEGQPP